MPAKPAYARRAGFAADVSAVPAPLPPLERATRRNIYAACPLPPLVSRCRIWLPPPYAAERCAEYLRRQNRQLTARIRLFRQAAACAAAALVCRRRRRTPIAMLNTPRRRRRSFTPLRRRQPGHNEGLYAMLEVRSARIRAAGYEGHAVTPPRLIFMRAEY